MPAPLHRRFFSTVSVQSILKEFLHLHQCCTDHCTDALKFHPIGLTSRIFSTAPEHPLLSPMHRRIHILCHLFNRYFKFCFHLSNASWLSFRCLDSELDIFTMDYTLSMGPRNPTNLSSLLRVKGRVE